jgi:hypothetical protein
LEQAATVTLGQYYLSFKSLSGVVAGILVASPVVSRFLPENAAAVVFPPIGSAEVPARVWAIVFGLATTYAAFFWRGDPKAGRPVRILVAVAVAFVSLCAYLVLYVRFVRRIEIPSRQISVSVTVGSTRTDFANRKFPGVGDWDLLRDRGPDEEEIWRLWTPDSLIAVRVGLFAAYCGVILPLIAGFSWGVLFQLQNHEGT